MSDIWDSSEKEIEIPKGPEPMGPGEIVAKAKKAADSYHGLIAAAQEAFMALLETGSHPKVVKALDEALAKTAEFTNAPQD